MGDETGAQSRSGGASEGSVRQERGFTLLELVVVVLIIATLLGIAIPSFLAGQRRGLERGQQANLRTALGAQAAAFIDDQEYLSEPAALSLLEPGVAWRTDLALLDGKGNDVYVEVNDSTAGVEAQQVIMVAKAKTGACFYLATETAGGSRYLTDRPTAARSAGDPCPPKAYVDLVHDGFVGH